MSKKFSFLKEVATPSTQPATSPQPDGPQPKRGRPPGKRTDPAYEQVTIYIRKDTHHKALLVLLQDGKRRQFSVLVEDLLADWLKRST